MQLIFIQLEVTKSRSRFPTFVHAGLQVVQPSANHPNIILQLAGLDEVSHLRGDVAVCGVADLVPNLLEDIGWFCDMRTHRRT